MSCGSLISIPSQTVDRVLDVQFARQSKSQAKRKEKHAVLTDTEDGAVEIDRQHGELLNEDDMISIDDWESKNRKLTPEDADELAPLVAWCYAKWVDLQYEQGKRPEHWNMNISLPAMYHSHNRHTAADGFSAVASLCSCFPSLSLR